jgi:hypothetical protein
VILEWPAARRVAFATAAVLLMLASGNIVQEPFIYFQF